MQSSPDGGSIARTAERGVKGGRRAARYGTILTAPREALVTKAA